MTWSSPEPVDEVLYPFGVLAVGKCSSAADVNVFLPKQSFQQRLRGRLQHLVILGLKTRI